MFVKLWLRSQQRRFLDAANSRGGDSNGFIRRCDEERGAGRQSGDADRGRGGRAHSRQAVRRKLRAAPAPGQAAPAPPQSVPTNAPAGSILGGLSDLIGKLTAGGAAPQVNSWVGPGANQPIQPGQLGSALGQNTLNDLAQRTGMSQQELLNQLAAGPAPAHQSSDAERPRADAGRSRKVTRCAIVAALHQPAERRASFRTPYGARPTRSSTAPPTASAPSAYSAA